MDLADLSNDKYKVPGDGTAPMNKFICHDVQTASKVNNCHIYAAQLTSSNATDYKTGSLICVACKPGFYPTNSSSSGIGVTACTQITNCDTSDTTKNTWMNGCETCESGYTHSIKDNGGEIYVDFTSCSQVTKANCHHENPTNNHCYECHNGFSANASTGECDAITSVPDNCDKLAFRSEQNRISTTSSDIYVKNTISRLYNNLSDSLRKKTCNQCQNDFVLAGVTFFTPDFHCIPQESYVGNKDQNCQFFSGKEKGVCKLCKTGFILNGDSTCIESSDFKNCTAVTENNGKNECSKCESGFMLQPNTKTCVKIEHCGDYASEDGEIICENCSPGYLSDPRDKKRCIEIYYPDCIEVDSNNYCIKCKDGKRLVRGYNDAFSSIETSYCSEFVYDEINQVINHSLYNMNSTASSISSLNVFYDDNIFGSILLANKNILTNKFINQVCHTAKVPNCEEYSNNIKMICSKCKSGFYKTRGGCAPISIENCQLQNSYYECQECQYGYYLNSFRQCEINTSENCKEKNKTESGCEVCNDGYYLGGGICYQYKDVLNCQEFNTYDNNCDKCTDDFYLGVDRLCHPRSNISCKDYILNEDKCLSCKPKHYLSSGRCYRHTVENCLTYATTLDRCINCIMTEDSSTHVGNFKLEISSLNCIPFEKIPGCSKYVLTDNPTQKCSECSSGYYMKDDKCILNPHGIQYCLEYSAPGSCNLCEFDYYFNSSTSTCDPVYLPLDNCTIHASETQCKVCDQGFILNADNTACIEQKGTNCLTFKTFDSCETCIEGFVLQVSTEMTSDGVTPKNVCNSVNISNCLVGEEVSETVTQTAADGSQTQTEVKTIKCKQCIPRLILAEDKKSCIYPTPIDYCFEYSDHRTCEKCFNNYVLSSDKKNCINEIQLVGSGCQYGHLNENVQCNLCDSGHMIGEDGACVECGGEGCLICNPKDTSKCNLCGPGFYMNSSYTCTKNSQTMNEIKPESIDQASRR